MQLVRTLVCFSVLSCASLAWAQDRSVVNSYKTDTAPEIDGEIDGAEWDAAGPWITVTSDSPNAQAATDLIASDVFGGPSDSSFRFKTMWVEDTPTFYILYEVFDDIAMDADPENLWERDQVETFIDGTSLDGDMDPESFHWWNGEGETYGKLGVSRNNTFEGNSGTMTDSVDAWDEGFGGFNSVSAVADIGTNADYRVEMGISIVQMLDDFVAAPFEGTPTDEQLVIVEDSTTLKFTPAVSDDDNFSEGGTERSSAITYYRELDGAGAPWDVSAAFADLTFVGEFDGVIDVPGDCNADGVLTTADLACATGEGIAPVLEGLNLLAGDFDGDGNVAFPDFLVLSSAFGTSVSSYAQGDVDGDGNVAFPDFLVLSSNFGKSSATASAVPEPAGGLMAALAGLGMLAARRRRSS